MDTSIKTNGLFFFAIFFIFEYQNSSQYDHLSDAMHTHLLSVTSHHVHRNNEKIGPPEVRVLRDWTLTNEGFHVSQIQLKSQSYYLFNMP